VGSTNPALSAEGVEQARRLAHELSSRPLARILSSDLERALTTAQVIAAPHRLMVDSTPALREIDFGAWEGRALSELWQEEPHTAKAWEDDFLATPSSFGESVYDLESRVESFWRSIESSVAGTEIAVVAHRGSLAVLRAVITGESIAEAFARGLAPAEAVRVDATP
jgi:alpha-ribazole phosphatase/probable phosphoglycerate mutase